MKRITMIILLVAPLLVTAQRDWSQVTVSTTEVAPGLYRLFVGDGVAVTAFTGPDGLLVIDAAYQQTTTQLMEAIGRVTDQPVHYLVNTHIHGDHTGGNAVVGRDADIIAHYSVKEYLSVERTQGDRVIPPLPEHARPNITFTDRMNLDFNGQTLQLKHLPKGHTGGDIIIYFPDSKVLVMGDLLFAGFFPFVDLQNGGDPHGFLNNLQWIITTFPGDLTLIGGHGPVYDMQQLRAYHKTLGETMDVVRQAKQQGMSQEDMKANRILQQWEEMGSFFITEDRWIDTIYPFL